jgi:hypothetical protein
MSLWGSYDSKTASGTIAIDTSGAVTGSSTAFTTELAVGDCISAANIDFFVSAITSDTAATVVAGIHPNATISAIGAGNTYNISNKPKYIAYADGTGLNSNQIYGVSASETNVSNGAIREFIITKAGSGYSVNAALTFTGGTYDTAATGGANNTTNGAIITTGRVTSLRLANNGINYTVLPTATVSPPAAQTFNANTQVQTSNDAISIGTANSKFLVGDLVTYTVASGNTALTNLTSGTQYYISFANTTAVALSATSGGANINLTASTISETGHSLQGETATVVPVLSGSHDSAHAGWVHRRMGTGGLSGRVYYETLVAMGSLAGDASDDNVIPDA